MQFTVAIVLRLPRERDVRSKIYLALVIHYDTIYSYTYVNVLHIYIDYEVSIVIINECANSTNK